MTDRARRADELQKRREALDSDKPSKGKQVGMTNDLLPQPS